MIMTHIDVYPMELQPYTVAEFVFNGGRGMIKILISALLVVVLVVVFYLLVNNTLKNKPTYIKTSFGKWFLIEANFETTTSETRN